MDKIKAYVKAKVLLELFQMGLALHQRSMLISRMWTVGLFPIVISTAKNLNWRNGT